MSSLQTCTECGEPYIVAGYGDARDELCPFCVNDYEAELEGD